MKVGEAEPKDLNRKLFKYRKVFVFQKSGIQNHIRLYFKLVQR